MNKKAKSVYVVLLTAVIGMLATLSGYAQEVTATTDLKPLKHAGFFNYVPVPAIIFGTVFVVGIYLIYHYWANGTLRDDMS